MLTTLGLSLWMACTNPGKIDTSISGTYTAEIEAQPQANRLFLQIDFDSSDGWTAIYHHPLNRIYKRDVLIEPAAYGFAIQDSTGQVIAKFHTKGDSILSVSISDREDLPVQRVGDFTKNFAPQTPRPPFPYQVDSVFFKNPKDDVTLAGTWVYPRSEGSFPAVIFITGSGPQDRDESIGPHKTFAVIADWLAREGIASLRIDDRGMGNSEGQVTQIDLYTYKTDIQAALDFVQKQKGVDTNRIGLIGHSEGGAVAPMVMENDNRPDYLVLLAPMNLSGDTIMIVQGERIRDVMSNPDSVNTANKRLQREIFALVREAEQKQWNTKELKERLTSYLDTLPVEISRPLNLSQVQITQTINAMSSDPMRAIITYDPRPALRTLSLPILALYGEKDLQVPPDVCVPAIEDDLAESASKHYFVEVVPGVNHLFQEAETGHLLEYFGTAETIHLDVLERITTFIKNQATP